MSSWIIQGQVGKVAQKEKTWMFDVAENIYVNGEKKDVIWYKCISFFKPKIRTGNSVIVEGVFSPSKDSQHNFAMIVKHVGVIEKEIK